MIKTYRPIYFLRKNILCILRGFFYYTYISNLFVILITVHYLLSRRYYHRSLNPKKLIDVKFSHLSKNMTMQRTLKLYKLPMETKIPGFRRLVINDIPQTHNLLKQVFIILIFETSVNHFIITA